MEPYARLKRQLRYSTHRTALPTPPSNNPTPTTPSRPLTPPSLNVYNPPCSDPT